jgi:hypothetical protein
MKCEAIKLQGLSDDALSLREKEEVVAHIKECLPCSSRYLWLRALADGIAALPYNFPGPSFNAKILSGLGFSRAIERLEYWRDRVQDAFIAAASCWAAIALSLAAFFLRFSDVIGLIGRLLRPQSIFTFFEGQAAHWSRASRPMIKTLFSLGDVSLFLIRKSHLPLQLTISTALACAVILTISRDVPGFRQQPE